MNERAPTRRDSPGVVVPPPLIFAGVLAAGFAIDYVVVGSSTTLGPTVRYALAAITVALGGALIAAALGLFFKAKTRPEPWQPTSSVVTGGIYRFTRNPMYLGMAVIYAGVALALDSVVALLLLAPVVAVIHLSVIAREERYLTEKFADTYKNYKMRVRPWL